MSNGGAALSKAWLAVLLLILPAGFGGAQQPRLSPEERQKINDEFVERHRADIAGRESEPAARVFKNIRFPLFKKIPAADLLDIMNGGYAQALGVTCTHCHVENDFSSDEKRTKRAAREMAEMHRGINQQLLRMRNLASDGEERFINCATCHRGSNRPQD
jgi:hypothetical protein